MASIRASMERRAGKNCTKYALQLLRQTQFIHIIFSSGRLLTHWHLCTVHIRISHIKIRLKIAGVEFAYEFFLYLPESGR